MPILSDFNLVYQLRGIALQHNLHGNNVSRTSCTNVDLVSSNVGAGTNEDSDLKETTYT